MGEAAVDYNHEDREYFGMLEDSLDREYERECRKERLRLLKEIQFMLEEVDAGYLDETPDGQANLVEEVRDRASALLRKCDEYVEVRNHGT